METLRSTLLPLTRNLPPPLNSAALSLLGPSCHAALVLNLQPTQQCLSLLASKLLGVAIIAASPLVKLDQIRKLLLARSAAGLSLLSCALETLAFGVGLAYNARQGHPFSTYGETALIAAQNVVIGVLVLTYRGRRGAVVGGVLAGLGALGWAVGDERVVGDGSLRVLQVGAGVVGVLAKAPQIWTVWREGGTGQLSAFAVFMYLAGSLARIFTTMREVGDKLILYGFVAGFLLNAVLAAQMVYYWRSTSATAKSHTVADKSSERNAINSSPMTTGAANQSKGPKGPTTRRRG